MASCRPRLLKRMIWSLKKNSRFHHELIVGIDKHGDGWDRLWEDFDFSERDDKLQIKYLTTDRYTKVSSDSKWRKRGAVTSGRCSEASFCHENITYQHARYDWIFGLVDDDFFFLSDWDYHLLKHVDINKKKIIYHSKQLCPREGKAAKTNTNWIGFEHPKDSTDSRLRLITPLKVSYAMAETAIHRVDKAFLTDMKNFSYGHNVPLLMHKDTILGAARPLIKEKEINLLVAADALWDGVEGPWTSLTAFTTYGCKKCSVQNSNIIHYPGSIIDDTQDRCKIWSMIEEMR